MICDKKIFVFIAKNKTQPNLVLLGIDRIMPKGSVLIFCADNLNKENYPEGWLYVTDRNNNKIEINTNQSGNDPEGGGTAQQGTPASNQGWNPLGLIDALKFPDNSFIWLIIIGLIFFGVKNK